MPELNRVEACDAQDSSLEVSKRIHTSAAAVGPWQGGSSGLVGTLRRTGGIGQKGWKGCSGLLYSTHFIFFCKIVRLCRYDSRICMHTKLHNLSAFGRL